MNRVLIGVVLLVVVGGAVLLLRGSKAPSQPSQQQTEQTAPLPPAEETQPEATIGAESATEKVNVEIKNFAFGPKTITVKKGATITFTNRDTVGHSATADGGGFDTGILGQNESGSVTFDKVGTFTYHCTPHPFMKATVVVE